MACDTKASVKAARERVAWCWLGPARAGALWGLPSSMDGIRAEEPLLDAGTVLWTTNWVGRSASGSSSFLDKEALNGKRKETVPAAGR